MKRLLKWAALSAAILMSVPMSMPARADTANGKALLGMSWKDIVKEARGSEVNWFLWGGADSINRYVSGYITKVMAKKYGITVKRVALSDTVDGVNIVLGEKQAGVNDKGSVDLLWLNGENFRTMQQGKMAWCGYTNKLPNSKLVDWKNPAIGRDFGMPIKGCEVPWNVVQFAFAYDSADIKSPPRSIPAMLAWIKAHPGRFTYPAPPDFTGSAFVRHVFYYAAGGVDKLKGPFNKAEYDVAAKKTWKILNDLKPYLWRQGQTYPDSVTGLNELFANKEVAFTFNYEAAQFGLAVANGTYPTTTRSFGLTDGTLANTNYVLVPYNSPHKAADLVVLNYLLSPEAQYDKALPKVWGATPAIDTRKLDAAWQAKFAAIKRPPSVVSPAELAKHVLPELQSSWITAIEAGWKKNVSGQ